MGTQFVHVMLLCSSYTFLILVSYLNSSAYDNFSRKIFPTGEF